MNSIVDLTMSARMLPVEERLALVVDILNNIQPSQMGSLRGRHSDVYQAVKDLASDYREQVNCSSQPELT